MISLIRNISTIYVISALALAASLSSCTEKALDIEPAVTAAARSEDLLQSAHITQGFTPRFDNEVIFEGVKNYTKSCSASFEQYYSVVPLYAFRSTGGNYVGDFYIVDATFSLASEKMYFGLETVQYKDWRDIKKLIVQGFFLQSFQVDIALVDSQGNEVAAFQRPPSPSTTINATSYTSGVSWSFNAALSGGIKDCNLTSGTGLSYDSSKSRSVRDISITNLSNTTGKASYRITVNNLPKTASSSAPTVAITTLDFHCGWVWQVDNTAEKDSDTGFRMKVTLKNLTYGTTDHNAKIRDHIIPDKTFYLNLPVPNRVASGTVVLTNTVKDTYMTDISFTDAQGKTFSDTSGSVYGKDKYYQASLPEGSYTLSFKLDGKEYSSSSSELIHIKRTESLPLASGYYVND